MTEETKKYEDKSKPAPQPKPDDPLGSFGPGFMPGEGI